MSRSKFFIGRKHFCEVAWMGDKKNWKFFLSPIHATSQKCFLLLALGGGMLWLDVEDDALFSRLAPGIVLFAKVFFGEGVDEFFLGVFFDAHDRAANL